MSETDLSIVRIFGPPALVAAATSWAYWRWSNDQHWPRRLVSSAHGALVALAALYVPLVHVLSGGSFDRGIVIVPFVLALVLSLALMVSSLALFRGPPSVHFLLLVVVPAGIYVFIVGDLALGGK